MYKTCSDCDFATQDTSQKSCPHCGCWLQLTTLPPRSRSTAESDSNPDESAEAIKPQTELLELPLGMRLSQIGTGILVCLVVSRWGGRILILLIGSDAQAVTTGQMVYLIASTGIVYVVASLAGGAVAGAWSVNWVPQGIGVGLGVLAIPLLLLLYFMPASLPIYLVGVMVTTTLTILGAYLGHRLMRPAQFLS